MTIQSQFDRTVMIDGVQRPYTDLFTGWAVWCCLPPIDGGAGRNVVSSLPSGFKLSPRISRTARQCILPSWSAHCAVGARGQQPPACHRSANVTLSLRDLVMMTAAITVRALQPMVRTQFDTTNRLTTESISPCVKGVAS